MIEIQKNKKKLILKYYSDYQPSDWIEENLKKDDPFSIQSIFKVDRRLLSKKVQDNYDEPEFHFIIGELIDDYYKPEFD